MLKAAIKHGAGEDKVRHRVVPPEAISMWATKLEEMKEEVTEILREEKEEKQVQCLSSMPVLVADISKLRQAEMELRKGQNMLEHEAEIYSRPARTWFQTSQEKLKAEGLSLMA